MRKRTAFQGGHFWENAGMFVFVFVALGVLWYLFTNVLTW